MLSEEINASSAMSAFRANDDTDSFNLGLKSILDHAKRGRYELPPF